MVGASGILFTSQWIMRRELGLEPGPITNQLCPQSPVPSSQAPSPRGFTVFQKGTVSWEPSVQTHEPVGDVSHSDHPTLPLAPSKRLLKILNASSITNHKSHPSHTVPTVFKIPNSKTSSEVQDSLLIVKPTAQALRPTKPKDTINRPKISLQKRSTGKDLYQPYI